MRGTLLVFGAMVACARPTADRSESPRETKHDLARFSAFSGAIAASEALAIRTDGVRLQTPAALDVALPRTSAGATRLAVSPTHFVSIRALDVHAVDAKLEARSVAYRDVATATDAFHLVDKRRAEEVRVLRDATAPRVLRWAIERGPDITSLRVRERFVEALDREGRARLRMERPFVVDANGVRRELTPKLQQDVLTLEIDAEGLAFPIAVDPAWGGTDALSVPHAGHDAVKLSSGKVLVVGGEITPNAGTSVCEIFDPSTRTWTLAASMKTARVALKVGALGGDKFIAIGGTTDSTPANSLSTAEIYDASTDTWTAAKAMPIPRSYFGAISFTSPNKVAVVGGFNTAGAGIATGTVYDPSTDTWTDSTNSMSFGRYDPLVTKLGATRLLAAGGNDGGDARVDTFDVGLKTFFPASPMLAPHLRGQIATLADGRVLVFGGAGNGGAAYGPTNSAEIYDRTTDSWTSAGTVGSRIQGLALLMPDGRIYAASGGQLYTSPNGTVATQFYDPIANAWTNGPSVIHGRNRTTLSLLNDGSVLMAGGDSGSWFGGGGLPKNLISTTEIFGNELPAGSKCTTNGACSSGVCGDGICCDRACTGSCESCSVPGKEGTCTFVTGSAATGHAACAGSGACQGKCDGFSSSCTFTTGECVAGSCTGGVATAQSFCDGAGKCVVKAPTTCSPFACGAVTCKTSCSADADCVGGRVCDVATGGCVEKKARGAKCTSSTECTTGSCADGYCCDKACNGACEACDVTASEGVCVPLDGVADKHGKCGSGLCADVCRAGACSYKPASTACGATCTGSTLSTAGSCSGTDSTCVGAATAPCPGNYACKDATACKTRCTLNEDCAAGTLCDILGNCIVPPDAGVDASSDTSTETSTETSAPDALPIAESGTTLPATPIVGGPFQRCVKDSECPTGHCVEGVCCDTECRDKCHSCALLSSPGRCTPEPIGVDLKSECGPALSCLGTCDGSGQCIGAGSGTMCARNRCTSNDKGVGPAYCAGPGATCNDDAVEFDCAPYACEPAFGACLVQCASTDDCAHDFVCDVDSKTCVAVAPPSDSGGCAVSGAVSARSVNAGVALVFLAMVRGARRRRQR